MAIRDAVDLKFKKWQKEGVEMVDARQKLFSDMLLAIYEKQAKSLTSIKQDKIVRDALIILERNRSVLEKDDESGEAAITNMKKVIIEFIDKRTSQSEIDKHFDDVLAVTDLISKQFRSKIDKFKQVVDAETISPIDERIVDLEFYKVDAKSVPRHIAWLEGEFSVAGATEEKVLSIKNIVAQYLSDCIEAERGQLIADARMSFKNVFYAGTGCLKWPANWRFNPDGVSKIIDQTLAKRFSEVKSVPIIALRGEVAAVFDECTNAVFPIDKASLK